MPEPRVEFFLDQIPDHITREQFDQIRNWFTYREDRNTPSMQAFTGELQPGTFVKLYVPGVIYGYSGMSYRRQEYWSPMVYTGGAQFNQCYFAADDENIDGKSLKIESASTNLIGLQYRVTIFYRDA